MAWVNLNAGEINLFRKIRRRVRVKIAIVVLVVFLVVGCVIWNKVSNYKIQETVTTVYGPYQCQDKKLTITQQHRVNNLEGAISMTDITVAFGEKLVFTSIYSFKKGFEEKQKTVYKLH